MRRLILLFFTVSFPFLFMAQAPADVPVVFRNTGKMNIAKAPNTPSEHSVVNVVVSGSMRMKDGAEIGSVAFSGGIGLTGHFIQDSQSTIFKTNSSGTARDYSFISFRGAGDQYITSSDTINIRRSESYVPFSKIELATNKRVVLPCRMGIDASSIKQKSGSNGQIWLNSNLIGSNVYDASLRITTPGASVDPGSVVVERYFDNYKNTGSGGSQKSMLFPFASPFAGTQSSGYFAGHWVRKATNQYVYGDKDTDGDGFIDNDQYVSNPNEKLVPGKAYLVKPRIDSDFNSSYVSGGALSVTGAPVSDYIKKKFVFGGNVYTMAPVKEQLNVSGVTVNNVSTQTNAMTNVVIGNSSTTSISFSKLVNYLANQPIPVYKYLYVYVPGSNSYVPVSMLSTNSTGPASLIENGDIPPMSVYIVRLPQKANTVSGSFNITPDLYTHGTNGHNLKTTPAYNNEVLFRAVNKDNPFQFDMTAIGLRGGASETSDNLDILKLSGYETSGLQLYTESADGVKLASNSVPETVKQVSLCAYPSNSDATYTLFAERLESLRSQNLVLEDLKTGEKVDLFEKNQYTFTVGKDDDPKRFIVHFAPTAATGIDDFGSGSNIQLYYSENQIHLSGLIPADLHSKVQVYDMQGRLVLSASVEGYPTVSIPANLSKGIYVARIMGKRISSVKFINQ